MSPESAESVFESGKSLRFLEKFHPNHPLSKPGGVDGVTAPKLEWKFSWEDLNKYRQSFPSPTRGCSDRGTAYRTKGRATKKAFNRR